MLKFIGFIAAASALWLYSGSIFAQGFSCDDAKSETEVTICRNAGLSDLDSRLSKVYSRGRQITFNRDGFDVLRQNQRAWLIDRDLCGADVVCLTERYRERLEQLERYDLEKVFMDALANQKACKEAEQNALSSGINSRMLSASSEHNECLEDLVASLMTATSDVTESEVRNSLKALRVSSQWIIDQIRSNKLDCAPRCGSMWQLWPSAFYGELLEGFISEIGEANDFVIVIPADSTPE